MPRVSGVLLWPGCGGCGFPALCRRQPPHGHWDFRCLGPCLSLVLLSRLCREGCSLQDHAPPTTKDVHILILGARECYLTWPRGAKVVDRTMAAHQQTAMGHHPGSAQSVESQGPWKRKKEAEESERKAIKEDWWDATLRALKMEKGPASQGTWVVSGGWCRHFVFLAQWDPRQTAILQNFKEMNSVYSLSC